MLPLSNILREELRTKSCSPDAKTVCVCVDLCECAAVRVRACVGGWARGWVCVCVGECVSV